MISRQSVSVARVRDGKMRVPHGCLDCRTRAWHTAIHRPYVFLPDMDRISSVKDSREMPRKRKETVANMLTRRPCGRSTGERRATAMLRSRPIARSGRFIEWPSISSSDRPSSSAPPARSQASWSDAARSVRTGERLFACGARPPQASQASPCRAPPARKLAVPPARWSPSRCRTPPP